MIEYWNQFLLYTSRISLESSSKSFYISAYWRLNFIVIFMIFFSFSLFSYFSICLSISLWPVCIRERSLRLFLLLYLSNWILFLYHCSIAVSLFAASEFYYSMCYLYCCRSWSYFSFYNFTSKAFLIDYDKYVHLLYIRLFLNLKFHLHGFLKLLLLLFQLTLAPLNIIIKWLHSIFCLNQHLIAFAY